MSPTHLFNLAELWPCVPLPTALPAEREDNIVLSKRAPEGLRRMRHLGLWRRFPHVSMWHGGFPDSSACLVCLPALNSSAMPRAHQASTPPCSAAMLCSIDGFNAGSNKKDYLRTKITANARRGDRRLKVRHGSGHQR